jgi:hypothetical protein
VSVSPGVAGFDRLRSSGLYLVCVDLNPPRALGLFCLGRKIVEHLFGVWTGASRFCSAAGQYLAVGWG